MPKPGAVGPTHFSVPGKIGLYFHLKINPMQLAGNKISIRLVSESDAPRMAELANDPDIKRFVSDAFPYPFHLGDAEARIAKAKAESPLRSFAIAGPQNEFCGWIMLKPQTDVARVSTEIGYWLGKPYWGQGYGREAIGLATKYAFETLGVSRVYGKVLSHNLASQKVMLANGYVQESTHPFAVLKDGMLYHEVILATYHPDLAGQEVPVAWQLP